MELHAIQHQITVSGLNKELTLRMRGASPF